MQRSYYALSLALVLTLIGLSACTVAPEQEPSQAKQAIPTVGPIEFATATAIGTLPYQADVMAHPTVTRVDYQLDGSHIGTVTTGDKFAIELDGLEAGNYELLATAYNTAGHLLGDARQTLHILPHAAMEIQVPSTKEPGIFLLKTQVAGPIDRVEYFVDGKHVGQSLAAANFFTITVPIAQAGMHTVTVEGFDEDNYRLTTATKKFALMENATGTLTPPTQPDSFGFLSPTGQSTSPLTFSVNAPTHTTRVDYWLGDAQHLGTSVDAGSNFAVFSTELVPGKWPVTARALNQSGELLAEVTELVTIIDLEEPTPADPPESETLVKGVGEEPNTSVSFLLPANGKALQGTPTSLKVQTEGPVAAVEYYSGNTLISVSNSGVTGFFATYTFWTPGLRLIEARAFNANMQLVAMSQIIVMVEKSGEDADPPVDNPPVEDPPANNPPIENKKVPTCTPGELVDCNGNCAKAEWVADGYCDDGKNYPSNFLCPALGMDGSDCGKQAQSPCPNGKILDCVGNCAKAAWINDGICDDGTKYEINFQCLERGNDGNDCTVAPTPPKPPANGATGLNLPYFYQYDNSLNPGSSCQNTSIAMVLKYYGWNGKPDTITAAWGKNHAQSPAGLAQVFNDYATNIGISQRLVPHTNGSIAGLKSLLAAGKPVIIHGFFTGYGHVVVVHGIKNGKYIVNDPAGKWSQVFKGGYPYGIGGNIGKNIEYGAAAFEKAVSTLNGSGFEPLWYHEVTE